MANLNNRIAGELFQLRDYHHAAKSFASDAGYIKAPYKGSGFHVNMSFNNIVERTNSIQTKDISVLVRSTDLPEVRFETETLNQYNRKRIIKKKVEYQPIRIQRHPRRVPATFWFRHVCILVNYMRCLRRHSSSNS